MARPTNNNIIIIQKILLAWFEKNGRKFPWRKSKLTNYQIVIAEALLQRTKAETVSTFFSKFIYDFPNWKSLASANTKTLEKYLQPIGLYRQRAKRLKSLATEMIKRNGKFPKDRKELESIPFLGQYIANAIELIIFKQPSPLLDVNMTRLIERFFHKREMADIRYDPFLQKLAMKFVDNPQSKQLNWAVLDFCAKVCKVRNPGCIDCELNVNCSYFKTQFNS